MSAIVFPEAGDFLAKTDRWKRGPVSIKAVLAVAYIFGGTSALIALVSKLVLGPLVQQLTYDRHDYAEFALDKLRSLAATLSSITSHIPPIKSSLSGPKYADAQTQTRQDDGDDKHEKEGYEPLYPGLPEEVEQTDKSRQEQGSKLTLMLNDIANAESISQIDTFKYSLEAIETIMTSLKYSAYSGGQLATIDSTLRKKFGKENNAVDKIQEVKKEIRSLKGSLLSTRSLPISR